MPGRVTIGLCFRIGFTFVYGDVTRECALEKPHHRLQFDKEHPRINNTFLICGKPAEIRRAAPKAHLREICGHLRPEPYRRAKEPHRQLHSVNKNPRVPLMKPLLPPKKASILRYFSQLHRKSLKPVQMFILLQTIYNSGEKR